jgi:TRAP-type C4-dicarboxylate transport system substrate-binding protein
MTVAVNSPRNNRAPKAARLGLAAGAVVALALSACSSSGSGSGSVAAASNTGAATSQAGGSSSSGGGAVTGPNVTIQLATYSTSGTPWVNWLNDYATKVGKDTNGTVTIKVFPNSQLVSQDGELQALESNSVGMAELSDNSLDPIAKGLTVADLPFYITTWDQANAVSVSSAYHNAVNQVVASDNLMELGMCSGGPKWIVSKSPASTLSDLNGMTVRSSDASDAAFFSSVYQMKPTTIAIGETYEALQLGTVDSAVSIITNIAGENWSQVAKYIDEIPTSFGYQDLFVNTNTLNKLSDSQKQVVLNDAAQMIPACDQAQQDATQSTLNKLTAAGAKAVVPTDSALSDFQAAVKSYNSTYINGTAIAKNLDKIAQGVIAKSSGS